MKTESPAANRSTLAVLALQFQIVDDNPEWPVVQVLVDGQDPFVAAAPDWRGFEPRSILGRASPLLLEDMGRRVAIYTCSCGIAGCGVIAPLIVPSPDGRRVSWVDFRNYTGVFDFEPIADGPIGEHEGEPWNLPDLHFDRVQYLAEVERASRAWTDR